MPTRDECGKRAGTTRGQLVTRRCEDLVTSEVKTKCWTTDLPISLKFFLRSLREPDGQAGRQRIFANRSSSVFQLSPEPPGGCLSRQQIPATAGAKLCRTTFSLRPLRGRRQPGEWGGGRLGWKLVWHHNATFGNESLGFPDRDGETSPEQRRNRKLDRHWSNRSSELERLPSRDSSRFLLLQREGIFKPSICRG